LLQLTEVLESVIAVRNQAAAVNYDEAVKNHVTPKGILVTVALLALYCAFALWFGWTQRRWPMLAVGLVAGFACVGAANMQRWSRFVVFAMSAGLASTWLYSIYAAARVGYFHPLAWITIMLQLIPGIALLLVALFCSLMAHRHLGRPAALAAPPPPAV
jgi:hypothetical protein